MGERTKHGAVLWVSGAAAAHLEPLRQRWDPDRAAAIGGHVTIAYPEEAPDPVLLRARLEAAAGRIPPFPLRLGELVAHEGKPERGLHYLIDDPVGMWSWLREFVLAPPFAALDVVPHATLVHPSAARSARKAFKAIGGDNPGIEFRVGALHLIDWHSGRWVETDTFELSRGPVADP